jgi:hypothetical protein
MTKGLCKLYVTKPVFGRDIGGLFEFIVTRFFVFVNPVP